MVKNKRIKPPTNYHFESANQNYDFTKICRDMQRSKAWKELSLRQHGLYLYLKAKFNVNSRTLDNNSQDISIPSSEAKKLYGDLRTFRKDIDKLIELGFIKQNISGVPTMSVSIYGFSEKWKYYGTDKFNITKEEERYKRSLKNKTSDLL